MCKGHSTSTISTEHPICLETLVLIFKMRMRGGKVKLASRSEVVAGRFLLTEAHFYRPQEINKLLCPVKPLLKA